MFLQKTAFKFFNTDLEVKKAHASYVRIVYIVFLREEVDLRTPVRIME